MKRQYEGYAVVPFAPVRRMIVEVLEMGHRKHMIHGLLEADVTRARQYIREYEATSGKDLLSLPSLSPAWAKRWSGTSICTPTGAGAIAWYSSTK